MNEYDIILRNGIIIDGTNSQRFQGDLAINNDRIAEISQQIHSLAREEIDVSGLVVAPGFVNMLSWSVESLILDGRGLSGITQGVTTEIFGEGWSMGPLNERLKEQFKDLFDTGVNIEIKWDTLGEYLKYLEDKGVSPNVASFVGATTLRMYVMGEEDRPPNADELDLMKDLTAHAMKEGALGIGSSLIYPPAFFAATEELIELCKIASSHGGMYITHMRSEGSNIEGAVEEVIRIATEAKIAAEIYHLKFAGKENWNKYDQIIDMIKAANAQGLQITTDMYLYLAGGTGLDASLPPWVQDGGLEAMISRLEDPKIREQVVQEMNTPTDEWENMFLSSGPENMLISSMKNEAMRHYIGKRVSEIAEEKELSADQTIIELILEAKSRIGTIYFMMSEDNVRRQIALPFMSFGSDAASIAPEGHFLKSSPHPRAYGNVPRLLGKYVREEQVISLEEAIHKLSLQPMRNLNIKERGYLKPGTFADITVFDANAIQDLATYEDPHQLSQGVIHVFVNGKQVLNSGEHTGMTPGRFLRGPGWSSS